MAIRSQTRKGNWGKINNSGMGGFLNPPTHPEHSLSIHSVYGDTFSMSLSSATESESLNDEAKTQARQILNNWKPLPIDNPEIQDWIQQVMGYFHTCYQSASGSWNAGDLLIDPNLDPIANQDKHAGVHLIRKYYPDFQLTDTIVKSARWGK